MNRGRGSGAGGRGSRFEESETRSVTSHEPPTPNPQPRHCIIIGGGIAGLAAAIRLREAGVHVTLIEAKNRLGGRATSFVDPQTGRRIDNCQHVVLGCCTNLLDFYRRLSVLDRIEWHDRLYFLSEPGRPLEASRHPGIQASRYQGGEPSEEERRWMPRCLDASMPSSAALRIDVLSASPLPAPLHLAPALLRFRVFSRVEKRALIRCMTAVLRTSTAQAGAEAVRSPGSALASQPGATKTPPRLEQQGETFHDWLVAHGQSDEVIRRFWNVIVVSACNLDCRRVGVGPALQVFREGFLAHRDAWRMGTPRCPLLDLYDPAADLIDDLRLGRRVVSISGTTAVESVTLDTGETLTADAYICAVHFEHLTNLVSEELRRHDPRLRQPQALEHSPILGVHLWFERPITTLPHAVLLDRAVQWVFFGSGGRYAHAVVSAADGWMHRSTEEIVGQVLTDLNAVFPDAGIGGENLLFEHHVIKERRATFAATPGAEAHRPPVAGAASNLYLAGDYTQTGWPATMEGAARSGYAAAAAILGRDLLIPDLKPALLYRLAQKGHA